MLIHFLLVHLFSLFLPHAFGILFPRQLHGVHHPAYRSRLLAGRIEYPVHPFIRIAAGVNEKITVSHRFQFLR